MHTSRPGDVALVPARWLSYRLAGPHTMSLVTSGSCEPTCLFSPFQPASLSLCVCVCVCFSLLGSPRPSFLTHLLLRRRVGEGRPLLDIQLWRLSLLAAGAAGYRRGRRLRSRVLPCRKKTLGEAAGDVGAPSPKVYRGEHMMVVRAGLVVAHIDAAWMICGEIEKD